MLTYVTDWLLVLFENTFCANYFDLFYGQKSRRLLFRLSDLCDLKSSVHIRVVVTE